MPIPALGLMVSFPSGDVIGLGLAFHSRSAAHFSLSKSASDLVTGVSELVGAGLEEHAPIGGGGGGWGFVGEVWGGCGGGDFFLWFAGGFFECCVFVAGKGQKVADWTGRRQFLHGYGCIVMGFGVD